jgi:hypothetical protein
MPIVFRGSIDVSSRFNPAMMWATSDDKGLAAVVAMLVGTGILNVRKSLAKGASTILPTEAVGTWF